MREIQETEVRKQKVASLALVLKERCSAMTLDSAFSCPFCSQVSHDDRQERGQSSSQRNWEVSYRMRRGNVRKVMEVVSNWTNPFEPSEELVSISSGCVVTETIKSDLLATKETGTERERNRSFDSICWGQTAE